MQARVIDLEQDSVLKVTTSRRKNKLHPNYDIEPFKIQQVADAGDITCNPFNIDEAIKQIELGAEDY